MGIPWTTNAQKVAPSAATGVSITPIATAWAYSAWVTVITSTSFDSILTGVTYVAAGGETGFEFDVGVGVAGAESVIATVKGGGGFVGTVNNLENFGHLHIPVAVDAIPAGSRVAIRLRKSDTSTTTWSAKITYLQKPLVMGDYTTTTQRLRVAPYGASAIAVTSNGTAWLNSSWVTIIGSAAADLVLAGIMTNRGHRNFVEYDIGVGAAASEAVVTTISMYRNANLGGPYVTMLPNPLNVVSEGSRVAVRVRQSDATATAAGVGLYYYHLPL